jgi:hypothetical protein
VTKGGGFTLEFKPIAGWDLPANQNVTVVLGQRSVVDALYQVLPPTLRLGADWQLQLQGTPGAVFRLEFCQDLNPPRSWTPWLTNALTNASLGLPLSPTAPQRYYRAVWLP